MAILDDILAQLVGINDELKIVKCQLAKANQRICEVEEIVACTKEKVERIALQDCVIVERVNEAVAICLRTDCAIHRLFPKCEKRRVVYDTRQCSCSC